MAAGGERDLSKFIDGQAEESGSEGSGDGSEDDKEDTGEDLQGFIVDEAGDEEVLKKSRAAGEEGDDDSSSSGDGEGEVGELDEEDLQLLVDAGLDPAEVRKKRGGASDGNRPKKAAKQDDVVADLFGDDEEDLFGEQPPRGETQVALHGRQGDDIFSDADEFDGDFIVGDDRAVKRRRKEQAAEHDISEDQLQEIMDIFGDTSVLRPIDEFGDDMPEEGALVPVGDTDQQRPEQALPLSLKREKVTLDDAELEALDAPERWYKAYQIEPMLCDKDGVRRWTDEEHSCQTKWIYMEVFWSKWYQQDQCERAIRSVLELLHNQKLEPIYILTQLSWQWAKILYRDDLWAIFDKDQEWQRVWLLYHQLVEWKDRVQNQDALHEHIVAKISPHTFAMKNAEQELKDCHDWFSVMHPQEGFRNPDGPEDVSMWTTEAHKMNMIREHKFDEKLGVTESVDEMSLKIFGIIPLELGRNVEHGKQIFKPDLHDDADSLQKILGKHIIPGTPDRPSPFSTWQGVEEALTLYLSRLIANEPRVRKYVRGEFMKMCVVSTKPTEAGKPVAHDAAQSFRKSYRAYHVANRPVSKFDDGDVLFLDILDAQRQGFVTMEYSLAVIETDKKRFKWVMLGQDYNDVVVERSKISQYMRTGRFKSTELTETKELMEKNRCEYLMPRLEVVAKNHEIESRLTATSGANQRDKASAIFNCATMEFAHDMLTQFMTPDPIYDFLQKMYCLCEDQGEGNFYINPDEWNNVRKRILRRALRDELYPMLWAEVQAELTRKAEAAVCKQACENLCRIIDQKPFRVTLEELAQQKQENKWKTQDVHKGGDLDSDGESDNDFEWVREKKARLGGCNSVLVIVPNVMSNSHKVRVSREETCQVAFVNAYGDPVDMRVLLKTFHLPPPDPLLKQNYRPPPVPGSYDAMTLDKRLEHRKLFRSLVIKHKPSIILLPVCNMNAQPLLQDVTAIVDEIDREDVGIFRMKPKVMYGDPSVARIIAYHPRLMQVGAYRDCELAVQRIAISMARFTQDPLAETAHLWHENPDENGILKLRLHRLQLAVPRDRLHRALMQPLMETVARAGVHVNRLRLSSHLASTLPFVAGIGPRKTSVVQRCLNHAVTSRADFGARIMRHLNRAKGAGPSAVVANCLPFFKICPDERDTWSIDKTDGFDRTRLAEPLRPWVAALCRKGLQSLQEHEEYNQKKDDSDSSDDESQQKAAAKDDGGDPVTKALVQQAIDKKKGDNALNKMLNEVNLDDWPELAGMGAGALPPDADYDALLTDHFLPELANPFEDNRQAFTDMEDVAACYLMLGEVEDNFNTGVLVHCTAKRDTEFGERPLEDVTKATVHVNCLPSMIPGSFKKYAMATGPGQLQATALSGCDRKFEPGDMILARMRDVRAGPGRAYNLVLSIDQDEGIWVDRFPLSQEYGDHAYFVPTPTENWTKIKLGPVDATEKQKQEKLKTWVLRPRNIKHPNWTDADHTRAISIISSVPMGNVLFRPSRRHDLLVAMLKVHSTGPNETTDASKCFRTFDIFEKHASKTVQKGFEIADELELEGISYNDFDEIIARHMDPIMENLRMLQEHPRFGLREGEVTSLREVTAGIYSFSKMDRKTLHYCLLNHDEYVGHGTLVWTLAGHRPHVDFLEISPQGFSLWNQNFATLKDMIAWFKKVGWRNSSACRKDWLETWQMKQKESIAKRGTDALEGMVQKNFAGWGGVATSASGLQTPGGYGSAAGTPTFYNAEAAAATPGGLRTPTGLSTPGGAQQAGSGYRTPDARNPATPGAAQPGTPMHSGMRTPMYSAPTQSQRKPMPMTPASMAGNAGSHWSQQQAPATPAGIAAMPATPAGLGGRPGQNPYTPGAPGSHTPMAGGSQTPGAANMYGRAPTTPAGFNPATPAGFAPATPAGFAPSTPATAGAAGGFAPMTPSGFVPQTPAQAVPGFAPRTPAAGFAPTTPGAVPMTPANAMPGAAPMTPAGAAPFTPAGLPQTPGR